MVVILILLEICYFSLNIPQISGYDLKISGVWEDNEHIGLVYKFYYMMSTEKYSNIIC